MPIKEKIYQFTAPLEEIKTVYRTYVIVIPESVLSELPAQKRYRVKGTINTTPFALAINSLKVGIKYFSISNPFKKTCKVLLGEPLDVLFYLVDPSIVDMPEELTEVLAQDEEGNALWQTFKPGMQRSLAHYVFSVKNTDSRIKRSIEIVNKMKAGLLHSQVSKK